MMERRGLAHFRDDEATPLDTQLSEVDVHDGKGRDDINDGMVGQIELDSTLYTRTQAHRLTRVSLCLAFKA